MRILLKWLICCFSLYLAMFLFPQYVNVYESPYIILAAGTVLWLVNIFIRPLAQVISIVATLLTFGIFSVIVNAAMVALTDAMFKGLDITSFWVEIFIAVVISAGNMILSPKVRRN